MNDQVHLSRAEISTALHGAAETIVVTFESVFQRIERIAEAMILLHQDQVQRGESLTSERLAALRPVIQEQLRQLPFVDGMGVLVAPDLLADCARCVEWWRQREHDVAPLWVNLDPTSVDLYDYLDMEWFVAAQRDLSRAVVGPYIDYAGADHYIVTLVSPVVDGVFLGAVGADIWMSAIEAKVIPALYELNFEAVLVNSERRVVSTNSSRWTVGSRLAAIPRAGDGTFAAAVDVGGASNWVLAAAIETTTATA